MSEKKLNYKIVPFSAFCHLDHEQSNINGKYVDEDDFVNNYDHDSSNAPEYGCGNMKADVIDPTDEVLEKYEITKGDYYIIAHEISQAISFGCCAWCS